MPPRAPVRKTVPASSFDKGKDFTEQLDAFAGPDYEEFSDQDDEDGPPVPAKITVSSGGDLMSEMQKVRHPLDNILPSYQFPSLP